MKITVDIPTKYIQLPYNDIETVFNDIIRSADHISESKNECDHEKSQEHIYIFFRINDKTFIEHINSYCEKCINFYINAQIIYKTGNNGIKLIDDQGKIYVEYIPDYLYSAWKAIEQDPTDWKALKTLSKYYKKIE